MFEQFDTWRFIGGIGLFLFAMTQMEAGLKAFAGRSLRRFLKHYTGSPLRSVAVGAVSTSIVQSSSLVGLMVLAFVGANIMSLTNALGVIFGANLGTTLTGWVVATIGFKLDIGNAALPLVGIGSLALVGLRGRVSDLGRLLAAIGLLLMGISLMKESVGAISAGIDVTTLESLSAWQYLLFGIAFAAIVQSSSAAMVITLAALHSGIIELQAAAAIAIGADLGTTSTVLVGAVQGAVAKKRVALAHLIFNITTAVVAFALIGPLLQVVKATGLSDPVYVLVGFHSLFNFIGIVIFLPIVGRFARMLEQRFALPDTQESAFVNETTPSVPDAALAAIEAETARIIRRVACQNLKVFTPPLVLPYEPLPLDNRVEQVDYASVSYDDLYRKNKILEGEILSFGLQVQLQPLEPDQSRRLNQLLAAVRHAVNSAKALRDVLHNLDEFVDSPLAEHNQYADRFRELTGEFYGDLHKLPFLEGGQPILEDFAYLLKDTYARHNKLRDKAYQDIYRGRLVDSDISSLLNVNREIRNSNESLLMALREYFLVESEKEMLSEQMDNA